jgi:hypothetical protein
MTLFELRKWYFDVITGGGDVLYAYIVIYRILATRRALLSAHLVTSDGRHIRDSVTLPAPSLKHRDGIEIAGHKLERTAPGLRLFLDLPKLRVDLLYAPAGDWRPNGKGVLLNKGRRTLIWEVPLFRAAVSGTIEPQGEKLDAGGTGYHDLVRTDIPPWRLPAKELVWGRAHFPSASLVWNQLTTREGAVHQNILVKQDRWPAHEPGRNGSVRPRPRWIDDYQFRLADPAPPGTALISHPAFSLFLEENRVLEESPVSTPDRIAWPPLRKTLDGFSGRPEERKVVSEARLEMGGCRERGLALHERVAWSWKPRPVEAKP